jgi:NAD(P)-dependent dehydrogenase (short-subunit alcohol dehydrogenase family)
VNEIRAELPDAQVEARRLDLASLSDVRAFAQGWLAQDMSLDVLFHIAGVMQQSPLRRTTIDGFEETLAVNVLSPLLLTELLLPALQRSAAARVIAVSSRLHLPGSRGVPVDFDSSDPNLERGYHPERAYKNSKLALLWVVYELARRLGGTRVTANAVCPGFVPETAAQSVHGFQRFLLKYLLVHMPFAVSVERATDSFAFMAADPSLEGVSGKFYGEQRPLASSPESYDAAKALSFWNWAHAATGAPMLPQI